ncbi:hypothetical protein HDU80_011358 [Chytriomyces hyalinus]|nr:hypothetical protein HDU80_011358 [Chytriomyces hyalinus]
MQATMPPAGANTATLSMILSTLEKMQVAMTPAEANAAALSSASQTVKKMQVTMAAMQQEVADLKETQLSILIGQPDLLTKVRALQNRNKKFYTRLQDIPLNLVARISWSNGPSIPAALKGD